MYGDMVVRQGLWKVCGGVEWRGEWWKGCGNGGKCVEDDWNGRVNVAAKGENGREWVMVAAA